MPVPLIGNGDITSAETALRRLRESGCHGLMIGRGAVGNPVLVREVAAALRGEPIPAPPTADERVEVALGHLRAAVSEALAVIRAAAVSHRADEREWESVEAAVAKTVTM